MDNIKNLDTIIESLKDNGLTEKQIRNILFSIKGSIDSNN